MAPSLSYQVLVLFLLVAFASCSVIDNKRNEFLRSPSQEFEEIEVEVYDENDSNVSSIHNDFVLVKTWDQIPVRNFDRYGRRLEDDEEDDDATYIMTNPIVRSATSPRRHVMDDRYLSNEYGEKYDAYEEKYDVYDEYADGMYHSSESKSRGSGHFHGNSHSRSHGGSSKSGSSKSGTGSASKSGSGSRSGSKSGSGSDYSSSDYSGADYTGSKEEGYGSYEEEYGRGAADLYGAYDTYDEEKESYRKTYRAQLDNTDMEEGFESTQVITKHRNKIEAKTFTAPGMTLRGSCNYSQRSKTSSSCRRRRQGASAGHRTPKDVQDMWMRMHNTRRAKYHKKYGGKYRKLYWDDRLADLAQEWCDRMVELDKCSDYHHDPCGEEGENLGVCWSKKTGVEKMEDICYAWCENEELRPTERYKSGHGHMTQMLWRATRYVGCAYAYKESSREKFGGCHIYACRYAKPGNCNRRDDAWLEDVMADDSPCEPDCPACMSSSRCIRN